MFLARLSFVPVVVVVVVVGVVAGVAAVVVGLAVVVARLAAGVAAVVAGLAAGVAVVLVALLGTRRSSPSMLSNAPCGVSLLPWGKRRRRAGIPRRYLVFPVPFLPAPRCS